MVGVFSFMFAGLHDVLFDMLMGVKDGLEDLVAASLGGPALYGWPIQGGNGSEVAVGYAGGGDVGFNDHVRSSYCYILTRLDSSMCILIRLYMSTLETHTSGYARTNSNYTSQPRSFYDDALSYAS